MTRREVGHFAGSMVDTPRLRQHVWTSGPDVVATEIERTMAGA